MKTSTISPCRLTATLALLFLFASLKMVAQPVYDSNGQTATAGNVATLTLPNFSVPTNNDRLLVVCVTNSVNANSPSLTFGSTPLSEANTRSYGGMRTTMYYVTLSSGAATSADITANGSNIYRMVASSFHNVSQISPIDGAADKDVLSNATSSTLTVSSTSNDLPCDCISYFAASLTGFTVDPGQTQIAQTGLTPGLNMALAMSMKTGALPSVDMTWTLNGNTSGGLGVHVGGSLKSATCPIGSSPIWYVDASAASGGTGATWECAFQNLQDAIDAASSGEEVWVKAGTYLPIKDPFGNVSPTDPRDKTFYLKNDVAVYGGFAGTETMRTQRDWTANLTTLSGDIGTGGDDTDNCYHVVLSAIDNSSTVLDGFTLTKGKADGSGTITVETKNFNREQGAGFNSLGSSLTIANCIFTDNSAAGIAGGMYSGQGTTSITDCTFSNNTAAYGGGFVNSFAGHPTLTNCTFSSNIVTNYGGGVYEPGSSPATSSTFINCSFTNNTANIYGGGYSTQSSTPSLTNCTFTGNSTTSFHGGGIYGSNTTIGLANCSFSNNSAILGGGIYNTNSTFTMTNCAISGNLATNGGGVYNTSAAQTYFTNCTISGNRATNIYGGGMYNSASNPTLINCIIWNNRGDTSTGSANANFFNTSSTPVITYSLIQNHNPTGTGNLNGISNAYKSNYPNFVTPLDPATAPSLLGDFHIQAISPVANVGDNASAPVTDLFGNARPFGTTVDLGVHELQEENAGPCPAAGTVWYVDAAAASGGTGTTWDCAFQDFQYALTAAGTGDTVLVAEGTYKPIAGGPGRQKRFILGEGVVYYGGFPTGGGNFASRDFTNNRTILSGDIGTPSDSTDNCFNVVDATDLTSATLMSGFTVERGNADSVLTTVIFGRTGGVYLGNTGSMRLDTVTIRNNFGKNGSAIYAGQPVSWQVRGCSFSQNNGGSAITIEGVASGTFLDCEFDGNTSNSTGGALNFNVTSGMFSLTNCDFTNNKTTASGGGGAIRAGASNNTFTDCNFLNNQATDGRGGAVNKSNSTTNTFIRCLFQGNKAASSGGGAAFSLQGGYTFRECRFIQNQTTSPSSHGGAVYSNGNSSTFENCLFWSNSTTLGLGGAIYNNTGGTANITNCTFNNNNAGGFTQGGGLNNNSNSNANILNSIFWGNKANGNDGSANSEIGHGTGTLTVTHTVWQDATPSGTIHTFDPQFTDAANGDLTLASCSPAIDTGSVAGAPVIDLSGAARPFDARPGSASLNVDLGAYELQSTATPYPTTANAGPDQTGATTCGLTQVTLAANTPTVGTGAWSVFSGTGGSFGNASSPTSTFTGTAGTAYVLRWTISNAPCTSSTDDVNVTFNQNPIVACPSGITVAVNDPSFALSGATPTGGTYSGTGVSGGNFNPATAGLGAHTITYMYTTPAGCSGSCTFTITVVIGCPTAGTIWYVDASAASGGTGTSWDCAFQNVQDAINAGSSGHEIWVKAGTYLPTLENGGTGDRFKTFLFNKNVKIYGGFDGAETLLSERDWVANLTTLSGDLGTASDNTDNAYHVVTTSGLANTATLDGFTVSGGNANGTSNFGIGAGVYNSGSSSLVFANCTLSDNSATSGSGMFSSSSSPTLTDCTFSGNTATNGGGMFNSLSSPTLTNCTFSGNTTVSGGGMSNATSSPILTNCTFSSNTASNSGGGMVNSSSSPTLINCTFSVNSAASGGGIYNVSSSPTLTDCTFSGNSTSAFGGGMRNNSTSSPTLTNCIFSGNSAASIGGGISNNDTASPTLTNCLFSGNSANSGGGMHNSVTTSPTLINCTISGNRAVTSNGGGGIYDSSSNPIELTNCIIWNNREGTATGSAAANLYSSPSTPVITYSLIQNITDGTNNNLDGIATAAQSNYPNFVTPLDPATAPSTGGDFHLQDCSPVANVGNNGSAPATDLDNNPRPFNTTVDLGAYERQTNGTPISTWYADSDADGYGDPMISQTSCTQPSGYVSDNSDCNDMDSSINPATIWYKDADGDGYSDGMTQTQCAQPMGYDLAANLTATSGDCDDTNAAINPAAMEVCNGIDDDCDMEVDEGAANPATWYADSDADGYGDLMVSQSSCTQPSGYVSNNTDCNDMAPAINPATVWYKDADGDGYSDGMTQTQCAQPMGYDLAANLTATSGDCDDSNAAINPAATEVCNGIDDDCDMEVDEGAANPATWYADSDADGYGDPMVTQTSCIQPSGYVSDNTDCNDMDPAINPVTVWYKDGDGDSYSDGTTLVQCAQPMGYDLAANLTATSGDCDDTNGAVNPAVTEVCNGIDDDCDMEVDEGVASPAIWYADSDADGYGDPMVTQTSCIQPSGYVSDNTDCNDMEPAINPATVWYKDGDGDSYSDGTTLVQCAQLMGYDLAANLTATSGDCDDTNASVNPVAMEVCNGIDDDCDMEVDEGAASPATWYADSDADGYGDPMVTQTSCIQPSGYVSDNTDCNDMDPAINPVTVWYKDSDGDGYSDGMTQVQCAQPMGYDLATNLMATSGDCDDTNLSVNPAATEVCNGIDDDCDMEVDEGAASPATWYADSDADGYGDPLVFQTSCMQPSGYVSNNTDCNDSDSAINPTTVWYKDSDGDGYSDGMTQVQCAQPMGYDLASNLTATSGDCEDSNSSVNPAATEVCNGIDDDCDTEVDEGAANPATWYADSDADGYGDPMVTQTSCTQPSGYVSNNTDCNDSDPAINPATVWYKDSDGDGYSDGMTQVQCAQPMGYDLTANLTATSGDCDDSNLSVNPAATEVCNGIDDDCDMEVDEGAASPATWYADSDSDGYGDQLVSQTSCTQPSGYVSDNTDCNDSDPAINPATVWYKDADGDGYSDGSTQTQCAQSMDYFLATDLTSLSGDCDDNDPAVNPGQVEVCNGIDDDCANGIDDGLTFKDYYFDDDDDGFGAGPAVNACEWPGAGYVLQNGDCDDGNVLISPSMPEICNGIDDDCSGLADDGLTFNNYYFDGDSDGYGAGAAIYSCEWPGTGYVLQNGDCNDSNPAVHPSATEVCNGIDDDCVNGIDDGLTFNDYYFDGDGDGYGAGAAINACEWPGTGYVLQNGDCDDNNIWISPGVPEVCNGIDDDCSGLADDGLTFNNYYYDGDGDGYGAGAAVNVCEWPGAGYVLIDGDCDDGDPAINPGATEICDGIDNNCNNLTDTNDPTLVDNDPPTVTCKDIMVILDGQANASITVNDVYDSGSDNCGSVTPISVSPNTFTCADEGDNLVTLTVNDGNGNSNSCNATVTVQAFLTDPVVTTTGETCPGMGNGTITINASAPSGQVRYSINGGLSFSPSGLFVNLSPGTYNIVVKVFGIANVCEKTATATVGFGGSSTTWYKDMDGDGYTDGVTYVGCTPPANYVLSSLPGDCDDNDPHEFPGQVWWRDMDNDNYSDGTSVIACQRPIGHKTVAELASSETDCNDGNAAVHPNATEICDGIDNDCDAEIDEDLLGETYVGNVQFSTQAQVDNWSACYTKVQGFVSIIGTGITDLEPLVNIKEITGNLTIQSTGLVAKVGLDSLTDVGGTLTIFFNSTLTSLNGLSKLDTVGGAFYMYYNFQLSDCCAVKDLLNGRVAGSIVVFYNKVGCNSVQEINNTCVPASIVGGNSRNVYGSVASQMAALEKVSVYPNPTNGSFTVAVPNYYEGGEVRVVDITGRPVLRMNLVSGQEIYRIEGGSLTTGIYLVQVKSSGHPSQAIRLMIE